MDRACMYPSFYAINQTNQKQKRNHEILYLSFYSMYELSVNEYCSHPFQGSLISETFQTGANGKDFLFSFKAKDKNVMLYRCNSILDNNNNNKTNVDIDVTL